MTNPPLRVVLLTSLVLFALMTPMTGSAKITEDPLTPQERAWYEAHGPIRYAPDPDYPPFESTDASGNSTGINFDLLNRMSRNLDIEFEIVNYPNWSAVLDAKRAGEVDMLGSIAQNAERDEYLDFVGPYMEVGEVFYITDEARFQTVDDLVGARVAVVQNYAAAAWLAENYPELDLVPVPDMLSGLQALAVGEVDAFFENVPVAGYYIRQNTLDTIRIMGQPLYYSPSNWAYTKGEAVLGSIIAKGMDSIPLGEQVAIFEFWTGSDLSVRRESTDSGIPGWLWTAFLGISGIALVAGAFVIALRMQVNRKTAVVAQQTEMLREANVNLEQRVRERTQELEHVHDHIGIVNHAIEDALESGVGSFNRLRRTLENQYHGILSAATRNQLEGTTRETNRISRLLLNLRTLDLATGTGAHFENLRIEPIVSEIVKEQRRCAPNQQVTVDVAANLTINADRRLLTAVLENLISNAWTATQTVDDARIRIGSTDGTDATEYYVEDNGIGIPQDVASFYTGTNRGSEGPTGTHLGLLATARAIHYLGGDIRFEPVATGGTRVTFTVGTPWDATRETPRPEAEPPEPNTEGHAAKDQTPPVPERWAQLP